MSIYGWLVLAAAALSGFFSLASQALRSLGRAQTEEAFGSSAGRLALLERHMSALRLTASLCRSLCNLALVVSMVFLLGDGTYDVQRAVLAVLLSGAIIAVFSVAIPHAWASYQAKEIAVAVFPVLLVLRYALWPVITLMRAFDTPIRRLSGAGAEDTNGDSAKQEILQAASDGRAEGAVDAEEVEMIASVIELGDSDAGKIMTPRTDVFALPAETPWQEACRQIIEAGHTRVPVYRGDLDDIVGILYAKDLLKYLDHAEPVELGSLVRKPFFVPETKPLDDLLREFRARKVHIAVVLDEYGGTSGLVTIEDVLEEIVGDIHDEYDRAEPALMRRVDDRTAEVEGRMYIDDLNEAMGLDIPEDEDYDTVAGFVFSELGYIPQVGETLQTAGATFTILAADERKIIKIRVKLLDDDAHDDDID